MESTRLNFSITTIPKQPSFRGTRQNVNPLFSRNSEFGNFKTSRVFAITCELKNAKGKAVANKIVVSPASAPPPSEKSTENAGQDKVSGDSFRLLKKLQRNVLSVLSKLPLAIGEMAAIAALMGLGTLIDQGEKPEYYFDKYPEDNPVFGFFTWKWVLTLGFDHMFSSPLFLSLLVLLAASLMACTYTTQLPLVKVARRSLLYLQASIYTLPPLISIIVLLRTRMDQYSLYISACRWSFINSTDAIRKQEFSDVLPNASLQDLGVILMGSGYEVFMKGPSLYAFRGLAGRFAPIGVHIAMLMIMLGGTLTATASFKGSVTVPQGLNFVVGDVLRPNGIFSVPTDAFNTEVHVNNFYMDYYDSGDVRQFHSDLSLYDIEGKEVMRKTLSVNDPVRYGGITMYQTDWSISALQVMKDDEGPFNLPMARLKLSGDKKLFGTFLPIGDNNDSTSVKGISMLARDLQSIILYDQEGKFVGVRRPNSNLPIEIDGIKIVILDAIGSTGLDLKTDPGVPIVYAGFGSLMLTTCISFLSHSQVWALQDGTRVVVGGKTNRAKAEFPDEMNLLLDQVPEIVEQRKSDNTSTSS